MTVGELTNRGYYLVPIASYNARKIALNGYLLQELLAHDCLFICVRLTDKGLDLRNIAGSMFDRHAERLGSDIVLVDELNHVSTTLLRLECFRNGAIAFPIGLV